MRLFSYIANYSVLTTDSGCRIMSVDGESTYYDMRYAGTLYLLPGTHTIGSVYKISSETQGYELIKHNFNAGVEYQSDCSTIYPLE